MGNKAMNKAQIVRADEYYTLLSDIEKEMSHYRDHFIGKTIFLNCDDPEYSNFWKYFSLNFDFLGLKKLISTHYEYDEDETSYMLVHEAQPDTNEYKTIRSDLKGNGDFRSEECIEFLKEADIVITNPPFSLWREYVAQLLEYEKDFIIIGNKNAVTYKEIFPLFKNNEIWIGHRPMSSQFLFEVPDDYGHERVDEDGRKLKNISACWFTNLEINKRHEDLVLTEFYEGNEEKYPTYDNYPAIEVGRVKSIPMDYEGIMGVPITFLNEFNPEQFEILGITDRQNSSGLRTKTYTKEDGPDYNDLNRRSVSKLPDGTYKHYYARILVKNKKPISRSDILGF